MGTNSGRQDVDQVTQAGCAMIEEEDSEMVDYTILDGLDEAVIGTCINPTSKEEVLVYDFEVAERLFSQLGWGEEEVELWLDTVYSLIPTATCPIFVSKDQHLSAEIKAFRQKHVH